MNKKPLELYVHIPFCVKKCAYCDFLSGPSDEKTIESYVDALVQEIQAAGVLAREYEAVTAFIGGGTPSILKGEQIRRIMEALFQAFDWTPDAEITMEMNPGTVDKEKLHVCRRCGINRLSIGLQSTSDDELKLLGRIHHYQTFLDTYRQAREAGFENINIDLISAIPGQSVESFEAGLRKAAALKPEHLSVYSLILEEGTPFYEWYEKGKGRGMLPPLPEEEEERQMYERTKEILEAEGFRRYEVSNYALPGKECRHNIGYWQRKEYLGMGIGAASLMREKRFSNTRELKKYVEVFQKCTLQEALEQIRENPEILSVQEQIEETMMLGLRMDEGISFEKFQKRFQKTLYEVYGETIQKYMDYGFLKIAEQNSGEYFLRLTEPGISVSNIILADFLL